MSNWIGTARSNYFKVRDEAAFREAMGEIGVDVMEGHDDATEGMFAVTPNADYSDDGGWPSYRYDEETDDDIEINVADTVAQHLAPGYVAVFMQAGAEKLRYVDGYAEAVDHTGERVSIVLADIYGKARETFAQGSIITEATY